MSEPSSKKRFSERQLVKGDEDDDEPTAEHTPEGFAKAGQDVMSSRRIVRARRPGSASGAPAAANPFAAVQLAAAPEAEGVANVGVAGTPPPPVEPPEVLHDTAPAEAHVLETVSETGDEVTSAPAREAQGEVVKGEPAAKPAEGEAQENGGAEGGATGEEEEVGEGVGDREEAVAANEGGQQEESGEAPQVSESASAKTPSNFAQLSSAPNAFSGSFGGGFGASAFTFGSATGAPAPLFGSTATSFSFASVPAAGFGTVGSTSSFPSLSSVFGSASNGAPAQLSAAPSHANSSSGQVPASVVTLTEVPLETGEEAETAVFAADSSLYEFVEGGKWKERGKGEVRVNLPEAEERPARLVMRAKGNYRLLLNANLFHDMKAAKMDGRGVSFACVNNAGDAEPTPATYAVRLKDEATATEFLRVVEDYKKRGDTAASQPVSESGSGPEPAVPAPPPSAGAESEPPKSGDAQV